MRRGRGVETRQKWMKKGVGGRSSVIHPHHHLSTPNTLITVDFSQ